MAHQLPLGDIQRAAVTLWQSKPYFPTGTIFLCIIDPGVGSKRSAVIVKSGNHIYIGPDNGIFSFILESEYQAYELTDPKYFLSDPSKTFHGRDIFAPVSAHAASGVPITKFGPEISDLMLIPDPLLEYQSPDTIRGQVLHADRFGNLLTSLGCFKYKDDEIRISMELYFNDEGQLIFDGYDIGARVKECWGDSDYEYTYTIEPEEVNKLFDILNVNRGNRKELLLF